MYINFITFYQDLYCSPCTKALLDLILITAALFTTKLIMQLFIRNLNWYNITLACISRSNKSTSKKKFYEELGLGFLQHHRWYRFYFYKFYENEFLQYLFKLTPVRTSEYSTRNMQIVPFFKTRHNFLKNIPSCQSLDNVLVLI